MPHDALAPALAATPTTGAASLQAVVIPERLALFDRRVWRDAALAWLAQHLFFLIPIVLNLVFAPPRPVTLHRLGLPWLNWDGWIYVDIAQHGYRALGQAAFFPLYPLLTRAVAFCLGGHTALAALLVANAASFGAYGLLLLLVEREFGPVAARRTLLFLLCFPASFFLAAAYTESLFLLLSLGTFIALRRHAWLAAGILTALASLTRPVGVLLLLPIVAEMLSQCGLSRGPSALLWKAVDIARGLAGVRWTPLQPASGSPRLNAWAGHLGVSPALAKRLSAPDVVGALIVPVLALAGYCGYLALRFGRPLGFLNAEGGTWGRRASWPWDSFVRAVISVLRDPPNLALPAALDLLLMAVFVAATILALRRLPLPYALYALASLVLILLLPMHRENWGALSSNKRFMVDVFPLFLALGTARPRRWLEPVAVILALLLQALLTVVYLQRGWVA